MTVINEYVNSNLISTAARRRTDGANVRGGRVVRIRQTFEVAAADDDGSVYRLFPNIPSAAIMGELWLACDVLTGATDWDMGLYLPNYGAVEDKDILADGMDISAGFTRRLALDALVSLNIADVNKKLYELSIGGTAYTVANAPAAFDICLTANTVGSGAGTITVWGFYYSP